MWDSSENQIELILLRHAKTQGNLSHRYIGNKTDEDILESEKMLLSGYRKIECDMLFSSPLKRCIQTALAISENENIKIIDEFSEIDFGKFEGKNYEELNGDKDYQLFIDSGGKAGFIQGEGYDEFIVRTLVGFNRLIEYVKNDISNGRRVKKVLALVHGGTIMSILSFLCGGEYYDYQVKNLCGYRVELKICEDGVECSTVETYTVIQ